MKLKSKLSIWSCGTIILIIFLFAVAWLNINKLLISNDKIIHTHQVLQHTLLLQKYIERLEVNIRNCTLLKNSESYNCYKNDKLLMYMEIDILKGLILTPSQKEIITETAKKIKKWTSEADEFITQLNNDPHNAEISANEIDRMLTGDEFLEKIRNKLSVFLTNEEKLMMTRKKSETETINTTFTFIAFTTILVVIVFAIMSFILSGRIIKPLNSTAKIMKEIAEGNADLTKRIPKKSNDEIGQLIHWLNKFIENLQSIVLSIKEEAGTLNNSSNNFSTTATTLANASVANSSAMDHMNSAMEDLVQISETNSSNISNSLTDIKAKLIELISFFDTSDTDDDLIHLKECIESVTETISEIASNTLLVENFITTIKEISTQSRILAVNASIQANKAGESGKGFSVIASEIKNLSLSSDKTIKDVMEIFKRINSLSHRSALNIDKIEHILKEFLDKTSEQEKALDNKVNLLAEMSSSISELSTFRTNQHEGINKLSSTIESIKDSSSNNAEGARNMEKASSNMIAISKKIKEKIDNFKA